MSQTRAPERQPIKEGKPTVEGRERKQLGPQLKMDMSAYVDQYPGKKLMLITDEDGNLNRWLDAGAEPIPAQLPNRKLYKGLNDRVDSEWVKFPAGEKSGATYYAYGLMMDPELYDDFKHGPERQRREDIDRALLGGQADPAESFAGGGQVKSYAASLPTGSGKGYNQIKSK